MFKLNNIKNYKNLKKSKNSKKNLSFLMSKNPSGHPF